jgi:glycosyltransferase involved in cell wall biosynthesis
MSMKVSVLMITYNHARYISEAVESVLMQQTTFDYELVIGEDCSTDDTRNILLDYKERYPDKIKLLLAEPNQGVHKNLVNTLAACSGEYVAILDGDDLWTAKNKLEIQAKFLDEHPDCTVSFHNVSIVDADNQKIIKERYITPVPGNFFSARDIVNKNIIPNCSVMFKNGLIREFPPWFYEIPNEDRALHILNAQYGKIGFIDKNMAAYRLHNGGVYSNLSHLEKLKNLLLTLTILEENFYAYHGVIAPIINDVWDKIGLALMEEGFNIGLADIENIDSPMEDWPDRIPIPPSQKYKILTNIYERLLFHKYLNHDDQDLHHIWGKLITLDRTRLQNRGIVSIGLQLMLIRPVRKLINKLMGVLSSHNLA